MDEIWHAGFLRNHHGSNRETWGLVGTSGHYTNFEKELVLTPSGDQVHIELSKSHGLENLTKAIKKVSGMAGEESLKYAVAELLKM